MPLASNAVLEKKQSAVLQRKSYFDSSFYQVKTAHDEKLTMPAMKHKRLLLA